MGREMVQELEEHAGDRIREDFGALLSEIRKLHDIAENRGDRELDSIAFNMRMYTCRLANTATLKMYLEDCGG